MPTTSAIEASRRPGAPWRVRLASSLIIAATAACATTSPVAQFEIRLHAGPTLRGPLSSGRLWQSRSLPSNCMVTTDGRLGCWGSFFTENVAEAITGLPADAWAGCLAVDWLLSRTCSPARGPTPRATRVRAIDVNDGQLCAALANGRVRCWTPFSRGEDIHGIDDAVQVAVGDRLGTSCARLGDGAPRCWEEGEPAWIPANVTQIVDIAVGEYTACAALPSGRVACWDDKNDTRIVADLHDAIDVEASQSLACARLAAGGVACWSLDDETPARRIAGTDAIVEMHVGFGHACGRDRQDGLWCWGDNSSFALGDSESSSVLPRPRRVPGLPPALEVRVGPRDACVRVRDDALWCWGETFSTIEHHRPSPTRITPDTTLHPTFQFDLPLLSQIRELSASEAWSCDAPNGQLRCFALDDNGNGLPDWLDPGTSPLPASSSVVSVALAQHHGCVALADGRVQCWGEDSGGYNSAKFGPSAPDGRDISVRQPVTIAGLPPVDAIAVGKRHTCARTSTGEVWCWGDAHQGPVGPDPVVARPQLLPDLPPIVELVAGDHHTCARTLAGALWCWGANDQGQLGRGWTSPWLASPASVPDLAHVTSVSAANNTTCAVLSDGSVHCWGNNGVRQASPRGLVYADHAEPVSPGQISWFSANPPLPNNQDFFVAGSTLQTSRQGVSDPVPSKPDVPR